MSNYKKIILILLIFSQVLFLTNCKTNEVLGQVQTEKSNKNIINQDNNTKNIFGTIALLPLGDIDTEAIETVKNALEKDFGLKVNVMERQKMPDIAWYPKRKRYRAEKILAWLHHQIPSNIDKIMALTNKDISTTKGQYQDWGICGYGEIDGICTVVSTLRIKRRLGKIPLQQQHIKYLKRLEVLAIHEVGHNLGLDHCPVTGCIMEDAQGSVLTFDRSTGRLCTKCQSFLKKRGIVIP